MMAEESPVRLPVQISPCPIIECVMSITFGGMVVGDAVFGIVYNAFKEMVENLEKLPILQIPEALRSTDPNLIFQPTYRLHCKDFVLQVGPRVFSISFVGEYPGWKSILQSAQEIFSKIKDLGFVQKISKFSIRYINLFNNLDIFQNLTLLIRKDNLPIKSKNTVLRFELTENRFEQVLHIASPSQIVLKGKITGGSIIDIDTVLEANLNGFFGEFSSILEDAHYTEKLLFFGLLNPDFLQHFNPIY